MTAFSLLEAESALFTVRSQAARAFPMSALVVTTANMRDVAAIRITATITTARWLLSSLPPGLAIPEA
jgi:hypothetical protein